MGTGLPVNAVASVCGPRIKRDMPSYRSKMLVIWSIIIVVAVFGYANQLTFHKDCHISRVE